MLDDRITESRGTTPHGRNLPGPIEVEEIAEESLRRGHEVQDVQLRPLVIFALLMLLTAVVIHLALWWGLRVWTDDDLLVQPVMPPAPITPAPQPGPGVAPFPWAELDTLLSEQAHRLNSYGWIDRETGAVHIPVERAMQLLIEQGVPARADGPAPTFGLDPAYELESEGGQEFVPLDGLTAPRAPVGAATGETEEGATPNEDE
jgi:hypothetical protein